MTLQNRRPVVLAATSRKVASRITRSALGFTAVDATCDKRSDYSSSFSAVSNILFKSFRCCCVVFKISMSTTGKLIQSTRETMDPITLPSSTSGRLVTHIGL